MLRWCRTRSLSPEIAQIGSSLLPFWQIPCALELPGARSAARRVPQVPNALAQRIAVHGSKVGRVQLVQVPPDVQGRRASRNGPPGVSFIGASVLMAGVSLTKKTQDAPTCGRGGM